MGKLKIIAICLAILHVFISFPSCEVFTEGSEILILEEIEDIIVDNLKNNGQMPETTTESGNCEEEEEGSSGDAMRDSEISTTNSEESSSKSGRSSRKRRAISNGSSEVNSSSPPRDMQSISIFSLSYLLRAIISGVLDFIEQLLDFLSDILSGVDDLVDSILVGVIYILNSPIEDILRAVGDLVMRILHLLPDVVVYLLPGFIGERVISLEDRIDYCYVTNEYPMLFSLIDSIWKCIRRNIDIQIPDFNHLIVSLKILLMGIQSRLPALTEAISLLNFITILVETLLDIIGDILRVVMLIVFRIVYLVLELVPLLLECLGYRFFEVPEEIIGEVAGFFACLV